MSADPHLSSALIPRRRTWPPPLIFFAVFGGPVAWFLQLNACFALASAPCFIDNVRIAAGLANHASSSLIVIVAVAACAVALAALLTARRAYRLSERDSSHDRRAPLEIGAGRSRFLALWGICFSAGSALLIAVTALAFFLLPRCAG